MSVTAEELEIVIKGNIEDAVNKIESLKAKMNNVLSQATKPIHQMNTAFKSSGVTQNIDKTAKQMEILSREIAMQERKVDSLKKKYQNSFQSKSKSMIQDFRNQQKAQIQLDKMKLRYETMGNKTVPKVKKATENVTKSTQKATKSTNMLSKAFRRMLVMMAIRTVIKEAIQGFNDLAQYSTKFNKTMSNIQSSFLQARNSITTAFAPALQALEPIITRIANAISNLFEQLAMWNTALFTNSKTYIRAKKVTTDYAKSVNDLKRSLAGFDELNVLGEQGQQGLPNVQEMFETANIPQDVLEKANKLKEIWQEYKPLILGVAGALAGLKLGSEVGKLSEWINTLFKGRKATKSLTDSMLAKNRALSQQTEDTQAETSAVRSLIPALVGAGAKVNIFSSALNRLNANEMIPQLQNAGSEVNSFAENTEKSTSKIGEAFNKLLENMKVLTPAIATQLKEQELNVETWKTNISDNTRKTMTAVMLYPSIAFGRAGKTIADFINSSSKNFANWCNSLVNNIGITMKNWYETFTSSLASAWDSFVGFMRGIGESISNWWSGAKEWVIPTATVVGAVAVTASAIATGGATLPLAALADGGVLTRPTPVLAGEYPGARSNPEIVTPQKLLYETSIKANIPVINAVEEMGDKMTQALSNIGVYAEFGYDKLRVGLNKENARVGNKLYST